MFTCNKMFSSLSVRVPGSFGSAHWMIGRVLSVIGLSSLDADITSLARWRFLPSTNSSLPCFGVQTLLPGTVPGTVLYSLYFRNALRKTIWVASLPHKTPVGTRWLSPRWRRGATRQSHPKHSCRQAFYSFTQPRVNRRVLIRVRPRLQAAGLPASQPSGQPACVQLLLLLLVAWVALSAAAAHGHRTCQEGRCTSLLSSSRRLSPFRTYSKAG